MITQEIQSAYISILREELVPATGCTEPIAIAYAAAKLRQVLGALPEKILAEVSGNILKNVKSVVVPNTGGMRGIEAAIAVGAVAGQADRELQVISSVSPEQHIQVADYHKNTPIEVTCPETPHQLDIKLTGWAGDQSAVVHITNNHSNIIYMAKNDEVLLEKPEVHSSEDGLVDKSILNLEDILDFATQVDVSLVSAMLDTQIAYNTAIAQEGLDSSWGVNIGSLLLGQNQSDIRIEAKAWAAAGSDARMSGCEMPVIILAGSGNQGITASMPVVRYAKHMGVSQEALYRALLVSDLVTIYQKAGIGRLSAYCGAISAGIGAGAGIAYLHGGDYDTIAHTVANGIAMLSGTICDGAKASCASKIAASVDAGILGWEMYKNGHNFQPGDGIVGINVDDTVANVGVLAREGMQGTDRTILGIMTRRPTSA